MINNTINTPIKYTKSLISAKKEALNRIRLATDNNYRFKIRDARILTLDKNNDYTNEPVYINEENENRILETVESLINENPKTVLIFLDGGFDYINKNDCSFNEWKNGDFLDYEIEFYGFDLWNKENGFLITFNK
jgi:hypothetical protein